MSTFISATTGRTKPLHVGFLPLTDAAPLVAAQELGLFAKAGLEVELRREVGWATIREKIIAGELDAAQSPAPMLWATHLGLDSRPCPVLTAIVLNVHGNAITLSERLWQNEGVRGANSLREAARRRKGERQLTFGVVFGFSSHQVLLRSWLRLHRIDPDHDVRIVVVPPAQMFRNLAAGTIDGYCVGEPWNTLAVRENVGWCPAWSAELNPGHVEKVLMVRESFAIGRSAEHAGLVCALKQACAWCDKAANREALSEMLASARYLNLPARVIAPALLGQFDCGHGQIEKVPDFHVFSGNDANVPTSARAELLQGELYSAGLLKPSDTGSGLPSRLFREDLYNCAVGKPSLSELVPI